MSLQRGCKCTDLSVGTSGTVISDPLFVLLLSVNVVLPGQVLSKCVGMAG